MRALGSLLVAAALAACGSNVRPVEPQRSETTPLPLVAFDAGLVEASAAAEAGTTRAEVDDAVAWLRAHGVAEEIATHTFSLDGPGPCHELEVGAPPQPALDCRELERVTKGTGPQMVYRDVTHERLRVVAAGKSRVVADVLVRISATDFPEYVVLDLALVANDATTLTLGDVASQHDGCGDAIAALDGPGRNKDPLSRSLDALDRSLVTRACALRGRFVWSGDHFVSGR